MVGWPFSGSQFIHLTIHASEPPIKRFAQKFTYLGIDAIASRDLGFAYRQKQVSGGTAVQLSAPTVGFTSDKASGSSISLPIRAPSPDRRRREPSPPPAKRFKPSSPPPARRDRERDRDRDRDERWEDRGPSGPARRPSPRPH